MEKIEHKRYLLFAFIDYECSGGLNDLIETFNTIDEIFIYLREKDYKDRQIYDRIEGKIIHFETNQVYEFNLKK